MENIFLQLVHLFLVLDTSIGRVASEAHFDFTQQDSVQRTDHTSTHRDMVSINMFEVYEKYSKEPHRKRDGNTVRSFKAIPGEFSSV